MASSTLSNLFNHEYGLTFYCRHTDCGHYQMFGRDEVLRRYGRFAHWHPRQFRRFVPCSKCGRTSPGEGIEIHRRSPSGQMTSGQQLIIPQEPWYEDDMCNLYTIDSGPADLRARFGVEPEDDHTGNLGVSDIYPRRPAPIVKLGENSQREMVMMDWGHPFQKGGLNSRGKPWALKAQSNIRNTTAWTWRPFLGPAHRCLVPVNRFAEPGPDKKNVWFGVLKEPIFAFAGIWRDFDSDWNEDRGLSSTKVFAFLTTDANDLVEPIHKQAMPVILAKDDWDTWLTAEWSEAKALQAPYDHEKMAIVT